jgi:hypothetical protein
MGSLVKRHLAPTLPGSPHGRDVYHVTLMPCFDKKLEASRGDFFHSDANGDYHDVDCVLTPIELIDLWGEMKIDFASLPESPLDTLYSNVDSSGDDVYGNGGGSGGYAEYIYRRFAAVKCGIVDSAAVTFTPQRNPDFQAKTLSFSFSLSLSLSLPISLPPGQLSEASGLSAGGHTACGRAGSAVSGHRQWLPQHSEPAEAAEAGEEVPLSLRGGDGVSIGVSQWRGTHSAGGVTLQEGDVGSDGEGLPHTASH